MSVTSVIPAWRRNPFRELSEILLALNFHGMDCDIPLAPAGMTQNKVRFSAGLLTKLR